MQQTAAIIYAEVAIPATARDSRKPLRLRIPVELADVLYDSFDAGRDGGQGGTSRQKDGKPSHAKTETISSCFQVDS